MRVVTPFIKALTVSFATFVAVATAMAVGFPVIYSIAMVCLASLVLFYDWHTDSLQKSAPSREISERTQRALAYALCIVAPIVGGLFGANSSRVADLLSARMFGHWDRRGQVPFTFWTGSLFEVGLTDFAEFLAGDGGRATSYIEGHSLRIARDRGLYSESGAVRFVFSPEATDGGIGKGPHAGRLEFYRGDSRHPDISRRFVLRDVGTEELQRLLATARLFPERRPDSSTAIQHSPDAVILYSSGVNLISHSGPEDIESGVTALQNALAADPSLAIAHLQVARGNCRLIQLGWIGADRADEVLSQSRAAIGTPDHWPPYTRAAATRTLALVEQVQAIRWLQSPDSGDRGSDRMRGAISLYRDAISLDPSDFAAWNNLIAAYGRVGDPAEARAAFERANQLLPTAPEPYNNLANALLRTWSHGSKQEDPFRQATRESVLLLLEQAETLATPDSAGADLPNDYRAMLTFNRACAEARFANGSDAALRSALVLLRRAIMSSSNWNFAEHLDRETQSTDQGDLVALAARFPHEFDALKDLARANSGRGSRQYEDTWIAKEALAGVSAESPTAAPSVRAENEATRPSIAMLAR